MPFQSEKQRRYLHANHPEIANRWEKKYGLGGIAELNQQLNSLPEYYMNSYPAAHGGLIPSHEAGIYGLEDGGEVVHNFNNYASGNNENVSVPRTFQARPHSENVELAYITPKEKGLLQTLKPGTPHRGPMEIPNFDSFDAQGGYATSGQLDAPTAGDISAGVGSGGAGAGGEKTHIGPLSEEAKEAWKDPEVKKMRKEYKKEEKANVKELRKDWKSWKNVETGGTQVYKPGGFWKGLGKGILTLASFGVLGPGATKLAQAWTTGQKFKTFADTGEIYGFKVKDHLNKINTNLNKQKDSKLDLYKSLPDGHPEKIALSVELEIGKKTPDDVPDRDGKTNIKIEEIETVNNVNAEKVALEQKYKEMDEAAYTAWLRQQQMEAKKQAYLRNFRNTYVMAAGGRVPAGYNTGGLSNLFRLKNV